VASSRSGAGEKASVVVRESQRQVERVRVLGERLDHQELVELSAMHGDPPGDAQRAAGQHEPRRIERHIRVGEIDGGLHGVL